MATKQADTTALKDEQLEAVAGGMMIPYGVADDNHTHLLNSKVGFQGCIPTDPCQWSPDRYGVSSRKHEASIKPNRRGSYGRHAV